VESSEELTTSVDDGWAYAGMQTICPVCAVTYGTEPKLQPGPAQTGGAQPGTAVF